MLSCIILNANRRTKNGGGLGTRLGGTSYGLVKLDETNDVIVVNKQFWLEVVLVAC